MKKILFFAGIAFLMLSGFHSAAGQKKIDLFNGKDLSGWNFVVQNNSVAAGEVYSVKDGVIHITGSPLGYMYTNEKYTDYILHAEWRWVEGASNSGIFLIIEDPQNPFPNGIECQLAAGTAGDFLLLGGSEMAEFVPDPDKPRRGFPAIPKKNDSSEKAAGEWNKADIAVKDGVIVVFINGTYQNIGTNPVKSGHIGLQSEGKAVQFRNVTLTEW